MARNIPFASLALSIAVVWSGTETAQAEGLAGAYLAARSASADYDFEASSQYFTRALVQDPKNAELMENAILGFVSLGEMDKAFAIARRLDGLGETSQMVNMLFLSDAIINDNFEEAYSLLTERKTIGPLVDGLALAWIQLGQGKMSEALDLFDEVAKGPGLQSFGLYHKALALATVGDLEAADKILTGDGGAEIPTTRSGVIAHAEILSQLERNEDAVALIEAVFGTELDPRLLALNDRLVAGETLPLTAVRNAREGIAEVFFTVAGALLGEADDGYTLVYTRMAEYLRPDHVDSILLSARLLENLGRYELATKSYNRISRDDSAFLAAELGRAEALNQSDNTDAAIEVLQQLSKSHANQPTVHVELGDRLRTLERFQEASEAYDKAISLYDTPEPKHWVVYFARGIALERLGKWERSEADFRKALELNPGQPQVLNYLGYSFVELQTNLDEALDMIERAVEARPNDGYITDSLGWVLYRLDRYEEAVAHMERATELMPVDPVVNDHLGDVYWAVGRKREAEFQWNRAMSFEPEEKDADRIRRKLDIGLDAVLIEDGEDPISVANDG